MKIVIIIPTYNESENIVSTIESLEEQFTKINHRMEILVMDSNSTDDTQELVKDRQKKYQNLFLITEKEKSGLGGAYIRAMKYAMDIMKAEAVFEFDADGSHQPKYVPQMVAELDKGADVVVGSRYVPGGSMPKNWALNRKMVSFVGNLVARAVLFTPQYKDMTSGFRVTKTEWLKKIDLDGLYSKRYAYKIHLYYELHRLGAKIVESPIDFIDRSKGESKFPKNNAKESLLLCLKLRWRDSRQFIQVCTVGVVGAIIQFSVFNLLRTTILPELANALGVELAVISNFIINNSWTFKENKIAFSNLKQLLPKFGLFNLVSFGSILIQFIVIKLGIGLLGRGLLIENGLVMVGILIGLVWNFTMYKKVIWKAAKTS
jgi:dolichol-phosphate mannosyltransferase